MKRSALCRSRRELSNAYLLAKLGFETAENEPSKLCPIGCLHELDDAVDSVAGDGGRVRRPVSGVVPAGTAKDTFCVRVSFVEIEKLPARILLFYRNSRIHAY